MKLRTILTLAFIAVAIVPLPFIWVFMERTVLSREVSAAQEQLRLRADNLANAIASYIDDLDSLVRVIAEESGPLPTALNDLAADKAVNEVYIETERAGGWRARLGRGKGWRPDTSMSASMTADLRARASAKLQFLPVGAVAVPDGDLLAFMLSDQGKLILVLVGTENIAAMQRRVQFGRKGHAAIVDVNGRVLAHPKREWRLAHKDLSSLPVVRAMMAGRSGIMQFYSPAVEARMVTAYTVVGRTGWGVMVPQPLFEFEDIAASTGRAVLQFGAIGIVLAALVGWLLAGVLTRPIGRITDAARRIAAGDDDVRVAPGGILQPQEFAALSSAFDSMSARVSQSRRQMEEAVEEARLADRAKSEFLANMSHELRTPLNAVIGFAEVMQMELMGPLGNDAYKSYVEDIRASGKHLLTLIEDILDLSKIESGMMEIEEEDVDPATVIEATLALTRVPAARNNIHVETDIPVPCPVLRGNATRLKQVLINLVSNAIKFTEPGGRLWIRCWQEENGGMGISVRDNGIGMSEEEIAIALSPFGQVETVLSSKFSGTGLGLPLAKRLTEILGGEMTIRSKPGEGTVVILFFPAAKIVLPVVPVT